jgi:hypothetical protein
VVPGSLRKLGVIAIVVIAIAAVAAPSALADSRISATAVANSDRSVSVTWNVPAGEFRGAFVINTTSLADATGELPFNAVGDPTIDYNLLDTGWTTYKTLPLDMTITQPTTVYAQVQLIDPFGDHTCGQGDVLDDCDSQVIPLTIEPICAKVLQTPAYTTTKLVKAGHWLRRNGHYVKKHGHRVWVKPKYVRVTHQAVYQNQCH